MLTKGDIKGLVKILGELSFEAFERALRALSVALGVDLGGAHNECVAIGKQGWNTLILISNLAEIA